MGKYSYTVIYYYVMCVFSELVQVNKTGDIRIT